MIKNWLELPLNEKIRLNNKMGFTVDNVFPPGTGIRNRFDKMCEDTMIAIRKRYEGSPTFGKKLMDLSPDELLKKDVK